MGTDTFTIGEVARATNLAVSAVRYYDEIGLIESTTRVGGKRRFDHGIVGRVNFIQRSKEAGFSLEEIKRILDDTEGDWRGVVDAKVIELTERRVRLDELIEMLKEVRTCGCDVVATCRKGPGE